jgi:ankyrin repeat protein
VRILVEAGAAVTDRHNTVFRSALAGAAISGHIDVVAYLLDHGADPDEGLYPDDRPLVEECEQEGPPEVAALLRRALNQRAT